MLLDHLEVIDPRFGALVQANTHLERLWTGARWAEGPAYFAAGRYPRLAAVAGRCEAMPAFIATCPADYVVPKGG